MRKGIKISRIPVTRFIREKKLLRFFIKAVLPDKINDGADRYHKAEA